jgi:hypothetical protein
MKIDWQGSGSGTDDENEWSENRQIIEGRTSPGSYTQEDYSGNNSDSRREEIEKRAESRPSVHPRSFARRRTPMYDTSIAASPIHQQQAD